MRADRPLLISVVQYQTALADGTMQIAGVVDKARQLGVDGVELRRELWPAYSRELPAVRRQIEQAGLIVTFGTHNTLFSPDELAYQLLLQDIDTAKALGSPLLRIFPGATPADEDDPRWDQARRAVAHAADQGIQIALENFSGSPGGTLAEIVHILDRLAAPALRTNIDIGNYPLHNQDVVEAIRTVGDRAIYVHVKDVGAPPSAAQIALGAGKSPLADIFTALDALPQRLLLCFEFGGEPDPDGRIRQALQFRRDWEGSRR
jgi:sugar phosphate isomerase/epimerase